MAQQDTTQDTRRQRAHDAWAALPQGGHDAVRLRVQCARSHHVATVYDTAAGRVFVAPVRAHSHGSRDRVDEPHGAHDVEMWIDLLGTEGEPLDEDAVPAWCDCGPRMLSRTEMRAWIAAGERRVVVD